MLQLSLARQLSRSLWKDESGAILSAELVIVLTIVVLGMITGLSCLQQSVVSELQDVGRAIRSLNQSYAITGFVGCRKTWGPTSVTSGSRFTDTSSGIYLTNSGGAEIGGGFRGAFIESSPSRLVAPEGTGVCPPSGVLPPSTPIPQGLPPAPAGDCPSCGPVPMTEPLHPQPEIPMGPVPQTLDQI